MLTTFFEIRNFWKHSDASAVLGSNIVLSLLSSFVESVIIPGFFRQRPNPRTTSATQSREPWLTEVLR